MQPQQLLFHIGIPMEHGVIPYVYQHTLEVQLLGVDLVFLLQIHLTTGILEVR
jgi:hypothetical protein